MIENSFGSVVLTANVFNPSIFTEKWMARNELLPEADMVGMRVFSPEVVQFQTARMQVLITPPKVQISFQLSDEQSALQALAFLSKTTELLPHTPFRGLGLNFDYFVAQPEGHDFRGFNRALFGYSENPLFREFDTADARFGGYFSKNHGQARLKLDIKPVTITESSADRELLLFSFNFHHDITSESGPDTVSTLKNRLVTWKDFLD